MLKFNKYRRTLEQEDYHYELHDVKELTASGAIQSDSDLLAFTTYPDTSEGG